ncbi:MAG: TatD family hydrolase [Firmicutes bacterium]|nr:TatD family hydrolase [Bacillota bacterium]
MLFDTHCHLTDEYYDEDRAGFIKSIEDSALRFVVDIGTDIKTSRQAAANAGAYDFCYAAAGFWPGNTTGLTEEDFGALEEILKLPKVAALGETGLDYHYEDTDREAQRYWFARQIRLAVETAKPICIHSRDADAETLQMLKDGGAFSKERYESFPKRPDGSPDARVLMHCFSGSAELARQYVKLGADISIAGPVTYRNARKLVEVVETVDISRLTAETDSPYLTPVPFRGQRNVPWYVEHAVRKIAEIKGIAYEDAAKATLENGMRFYGIKA